MSIVVKTIQSEGMTDDGLKYKWAELTSVCDGDRVEIDGDLLKVLDGDVITGVFKASEVSSAVRFPPDKDGRAIIKHLAKDATLTQ